MSLLNCQHGLSREEFGLWGYGDSNVTMNFVSLNINGVSDRRKANWIRKLKSIVKADFVGIQETHQANLSEIDIRCFWDRSNMCAASVDSVGRSGGLLSIWNPDVFQVNQMVKNQRFLLLSDVLSGVDARVHVLNVHAPNDPRNRRSLWAVLSELIGQSGEMWILLGDFNEVRSEGERVNSIYDRGASDAFNSFIANAGLFEYSMIGDSDIVDNVVSPPYGDDDASLLDLVGSLKKLKLDIKKWRKSAIEAENQELKDLADSIEKIENKAISSQLSDVEKCSRIDLRIKLDKLERKKASDLQQKARANWLKFGDENSAYFHNSVSVNLLRNRINGLMFNNRFVSDPVELQEEIRLWFKKLFSEPIRRRPDFSALGVSVIPDHSKSSLCDSFSEEEVFLALKNCDGGKAPGPDGFTL
ncbi:uncharacterized protein LOC110876989 [Helianthus annuus]|uniref:uncharacterized protein LOC110876989 n=1 Tax=Helianthus annuus TaxID=4232 RepID=UPI000B8F4AC5|nr:uncharacterized protein LOC110876989 [Helianthus annuus]